MSEDPTTWMELEAAAGAVIRRALAARPGRGAARGAGATVPRLAEQAAAQLEEAWRQRSAAAAAACGDLGVAPAPLFAKGGSGGVGWPARGEALRARRALRTREAREAHEALWARLVLAEQEAETALEGDPAADPLAARFEAARSPAGRQRGGQHLTPAPVADLTLGLAGLPTAGPVLDPTCGTGTFLVRAAAWPGLPATASLWGSDLDPLAVQLARLNLARFPGRETHLGVQDALALAPGVKVGGAPLPAPSAVVGNLPFVRLHHQGSSKSADRLADLARRWARRDPDLVRTPRGGAPALRLGGHGDLYAFLLFHLAEVMPPGTRFSLLTSNAWLEDRYGEALRALLIRHFTLEAVVESQRERWFPDAAVNAVILVATRGATGRGQGAPKPDAQFVSLHRALLPHDDPEEAEATGEAVAQGSQEDPRALARAVLAGEAHPALRRAAVRLEALGEGKDEGKGHTAPTPRGWSRHLRTSAIYDALEGAPGLGPAGAWLAVRRGLTTNCNPFFYPGPGDAAGIEPEYLRPVVRSPRGGDQSLLLEAGRLEARLFCCPRPLEELRALGHVGALAWIARGAALTNGRGRPLPEVLTGRPWYALRPVVCRVLFTKALHDTHRHRLLDVPAAIDQRLYGVTALGDAATAPGDGPGPPATDHDPAVPPELIAAALNSSMTALSAEVIGSTNLGEGALDLPVGRVTAGLLVPDGRRLEARARDTVLKAFWALARRPVGPVWDEVTQPDRQALDAAWLAGLGLPAPWLGAIHEALVERVRLRLDRADARPRR